MKRVIVADAGPLIALARTGHLGLLSALFHEVLIPQAIREELKLSSDRPGARELRRAVAPGGWMKVRKVDTQMEMSPALGPGEKEAILLASRKKTLLLIDDHKARQAAKSLDVRVIGTGRLLIEAKRQGLLKHVAPVLDEFAAAGYRLSGVLVRHMKKLAKER